MHYFFQELRDCFLLFSPYLSLNKFIWKRNVVHSTFVSIVGRSWAKLTELSSFSSDRSYIVVLVQCWVLGTHIVNWEAEGTEGTVATEGKGELGDWETRGLWEAAARLDAVWVVRVLHYIMKLMAQVSGVGAPRIYYRRCFVAAANTRKIDPRLVNSSQFAHYTCAKLLLGRVEKPDARPIHITSNLGNTTAMLSNSSFYVILQLWIIFSISLHMLLWF